MFALNTIRPSRPSWKLLLAVLCVALILLGGILSVTHDHPNGVPRNDCALCSTAHLAVKAGQSVTQVPVKFWFVGVETAVVVTRPRTLLLHFALFTRPPPADSSLA